MRRPGTRHASNGRSVPLLVRLYALLLWLYPARFRREYGDEMLRVLRERVRETRGPDAVVWLWGWALGDLLRSALAERVKAEVPMDAKVWSRVAGAAAILGGALAIVIEVIFALPFFAGAGEGSAITQTSDAVANSWGMSAQVVLVPVLFLFVALVLAVRLWRHAPRLVALGLALVFVGTLLRALFWYEPAIIPRIFPLSALFNMPEGTPTTLTVVLDHFTQAGEACFVVGLVLLGLVLLQVRLLPWGNWLLLALAALVLLSSIVAITGLPFLPAFFLVTTWIFILFVLSGLAWVALGVSLFRSAAQPTPVPVTTRG